MQIPFQEFIAIARKLSPWQKEELQKALSSETSDAGKSSRLKELLLNGPRLSESEINAIEEAHKSINQWRTKR